MAHSIELLLDPESDAVVRAAWTALLEADLPSQGTIRSSSNRPHITLLAAERIDPAVDATVADLADRLPLTVELGATLAFRGRRSTVALLVVPSPELLSLHGEVLHRARPFVTGSVFAHNESGAWTPHVTVARRVDDDHLGRVLAATRDSLATVSTIATVVGIRRWDSDAREDVALVRVAY